MKRYAQKREIPAIFSGLAKARESLVSSWHIASYSTHNARHIASNSIPAVPQVGAWQKKSTSILARWSSAYNAYLNIQNDNLTDTRRKGTAALCVLKELGSTSKLIAQTTVDDERNWDVFCPMFQKIVSLAEDIIQLNLKPIIRAPEYCINMAIIAPLFKVSILPSIIFYIGIFAIQVNSSNHRGILLLTLYRCLVAVEILLPVGELSWPSETTIEWKENGTLS